MVQSRSEKEGCIIIIFFPSYSMQISLRFAEEREPHELLLNQPDWATVSECHGHGSCNIRNQNRTLNGASIDTVCQNFAKTHHAAQRAPFLGQTY